MQDSTMWEDLRERVYSLLETPNEAAADTIKTVSLFLIAESLSSICEIMDTAEDEDA